MEELYYLCSENKGADLICAFVFAYADYWFSHAVAHIHEHVNIVKLMHDKITNQSQLSQEDMLI